MITMVKRAPFNCVLVHRFSSWRSWMYWLLELCWYTHKIQHLSLSLPHYPLMSLISSLSSTLTISPSHSCTLSYFTSLSLSPSLSFSLILFTSLSLSYVPRFKKIYVVYVSQYLHTSSNRFWKSSSKLFCMLHE